MTTSDSRGYVSACGWLGVTTWFVCIGRDPPGQGFGHVDGSYVGVDKMEGKLGGNARQRQAEGVVGAEPWGAHRVGWYAATRCTRPRMRHSTALCLGAAAKMGKGAGHGHRIDAADAPRGMQRRRVQPARILGVRNRDAMLTDARRQAVHEMVDRAGRVRQPVTRGARAGT